jgi:hypothetical protein
VTKNGSPYASGSGSAIAFTPDDEGGYVATLSITDDDGGIGSASATINVTNVSPSATITGAPASVPEGTSISLGGTATDPGSDTFTYTWSVTKNGSPYQAGTGSAFSFVPNDNGTYAVALSVGDGDGGSGTASVSIAVTNVAPLIGSVSGPSAPLALGSSASIAIGYADAGAADTHTMTVLWEDGSSSNVNCSAGACSAAHTYTAAGVYTIGVTLRDDDGGTATAAFEYAVIYDPKAGFVTGGGWIMSSPGAYADNPSLTGKASFGFSSKYTKGATVPTGDTQFRFDVAGFVFESTSYSWLVVSGARSQYKGEGTVNGTGNYGFLLTATDGDAAGGGGTDRFRIKIWRKDSGATVYDNVMGASDSLDSASPQQIGGGQIMIHAVK